jgi:hypothetical protein
VSLEDAGALKNFLAVGTLDVRRLWPSADADVAVNRRVSVQRAQLRKSPVANDADVRFLVGLKI